MSISALQISGGMFSAGDPSPARDGIISLHPDFPDFGEFRNSSGKEGQPLTPFLFQTTLVEPFWGTTEPSIIKSVDCTSLCRDNADKQYITIQKNLSNLKNGRLMSLYGNVPFIFTCMFP